LQRRRFFHRNRPYRLEPRHSTPEKSRLSEEGRLKNKTRSESDRRLPALVGPDRASLEIDLLVGGMRALAIDAWAMCARDAADVRLLDAFGRDVIPDLCARDASMTPMVIAPGRYLLQASTDAGPCVVQGGYSPMTINRF
jgi:hypothetical protein